MSCQAPFDHVDTLYCLDLECSGWCIVPFMQTGIRMAPYFILCLPSCYLRMSHVMARRLVQVHVNLANRLFEFGKSTLDTNQVKIPKQALAIIDCQFNFGSGALIVLPTIVMNIPPTIVKIAIH